MNENSMD